ncbi:MULTISPECIES: hypothetical protein [Ramlibacter]|uniref:Uncharacterized protein n=1 Tax=Ramlibacter aquaticus TaxID=2780094 RepID=A0ABR9SFX9_9BURK|nr:MULTISPECIES: hypothetical protein [Ramlibacter]MBE7941236.1 hypothetical protein [Ramlibacter aquaticus]
MKKNPSWWLAAVLALPAVALAQAPAPAHDEALRYQSAFADYKPWQDLAPGDWRALNGGPGPAGAAQGLHGGPAAQPPAAAATPPAPMRHGGPGMQGMQGVHGMHDMPMEGGRK